MNIEFEQVAIATRSKDTQSRILGFLKHMGYEDQAHDRVIAKGTVRAAPSKLPVENRAHLGFVYGFIPHEFEVLHYVPGEGPHWLASYLPHNGAPIFSHVGAHVDDVDEATKTWVSQGFSIVQQVETVSHTNPFLIENGRTFRYAVVGTRQLLGFDIKFIQRLEKPKVEL